MIYDDRYPPPPTAADLKAAAKAVPTTPCATWVLGWKCKSVVIGIDASRVCPDCKPKLPVPPYDGHETLAGLVWERLAIERDKRYPAPTFK